MSQLDTLIRFVGESSDRLRFRLLLFSFLSSPSLFSLPLNTDDGKVGSDFFFTGSATVRLTGGLGLLTASNKLIALSNLAAEDKTRRETVSLI